MNIDTSYSLWGFILYVCCGDGRWSSKLAERGQANLERTGLDGRWALPPPVQCTGNAGNPTQPIHQSIHQDQDLSAVQRKLTKIGIQSAKVPRLQKDARRMAVSASVSYVVRGGDCNLSGVFWFQWHIRLYFSSECCGVFRFLHLTAACRSSSFATPRNCLSPLASSMSFWQLLASWNLAMKHWRSWSFAYQDLKWKATMKTGPHGKWRTCRIVRLETVDEEESTCIAVHEGLEGHSNNWQRRMEMGRWAQDNWAGIETQYLSSYGQIM